MPLVREILLVTISAAVLIGWVIIIKTLLADHRSWHYTRLRRRR